jgi:SAM-dependent methyltransferase
MTSSINQEDVFLDSEADAWFSRNAESAIEPAAPDQRVLTALRQVDLPSVGMLLDVGGASGKIAEAFRLQHPSWQCRVVEPSAEAIAAGTKAFPSLEFSQGSIAQSQGMPWTEQDVVIVSGVFCWVDRRLMSRAVCNVDMAVKPGGKLLISDFDPPFLRANPYKHHPGLYTYKQDYAEIFRQLGTYQMLYRVSESMASHSASDVNDSYDCQWVTTVLQKDLHGRYFHSN